ncbi:MAG: PEP/pyruvate-binding domain-containing protein [Betaproteobacteria bacterium]
MSGGSHRAVPRFGRRFLDAPERVTAIAGGSPGSKARGLLLVHDLLADRFSADLFPQFRVDVPAMTVLQTDAFDRFMAHNDLQRIVDDPLADRQIALAFQAAELPPEIVGDLRALVEQVRSPLAIRSSSMLEDALRHPFAGVYATKMIPNDQPDADSRFRRLAEAIKLVYASTFFVEARRYLAAAGRGVADEKMAVIVQEVVGRRHRTRFYPDLSGVARSYSFYRSGTARPEDGVVDLAVGLGKTIVDGELVWSYSPAYPRATPPFASTGELLDRTQTSFWSVRMEGTPRYDPVEETEYLVRAGLAEAEADGGLRFTASSYDPDGDRLYPGLRGSGARAVTFAPLLVLEEFPVNALVRTLLSISEDAVGGPVEIEFAATLARDQQPPGRFGFLQVRPMLVSSQPVTIEAAEARIPSRLLASHAALGNGEAQIRDVVFVRPETFDASLTRAIAAEVAEMNRRLVDASRPYLLIGFGRWGSSDPWLGIPVDWASIAGARAIVETGIAGMNVAPSQGSHFFHNLSSFGVLYLTVRAGVDPPIDWEWLGAQRIAHETAHVRHVSLKAPLVVKVDGRSGEGLVRRDAGGGAS